MWSKENIIAKSCEEAYVYGVQLLLSTILNVLCITAISCLAQQPFAWIPFLIGFVPLRITAGGFHAKTPLRCSITFCGSYLVCMGLLQMMPDNSLFISILANSTVATLAVYFWSPVPASNKPLSSEEKKRNRSLSLAIVSTFLLISLSAIQLHIALKFILYVSFGELIAAIFLLMSKICQTFHR